METVAELAVPDIFELTCPGCNGVLARAVGWHVEVEGGKVHIMGNRVALRCPKCRRIRVWKRPPKMT